MIIINIERFETHSHSHYSNIRMLDSINKLDDMMLTAHNLGLSGICLTDHETLSGAVEWLQIESELKEKGKLPENFKCGIGNEIYLLDERVPSKQYYHFILIAKDTIGFRQLCKLSSKAWYECFEDRRLERVPTTKKELEDVIMAEPGHLIAQTACLGGEVATETLACLRAENQDSKEEHRKKVRDFIRFCKKLFGDDFYLEVAPGASEDQLLFNETALELAEAFGLKMVLATDAHYLTAKDRFVHKAFLTSEERNNSNREVDAFYQYSHLMNNDEAFGYLNQAGYDISQFEKMCQNTMEIYGKIGKYEIQHNPIIPHIDVRDYAKKNFEEDYPILKKLFASDDPQERYWANQCYDALVNKKLLNEKYLARLEKEADIIDTIGTKLGNCLFEYFNTFQHYIDLFWECGSVVGPGRGSSVCFLSNYLLGITQLDPIEWELAEFRFLNKERVELPDVDIDLDPTKRPDIFAKIREERGELGVIQVATFGTESSKSAVQCCARGYRSEEYPEGIDVDEALYLSSLIPSERGMTWTIAEVLEGNEEKERAPIRAFIDEIHKYPGFEEILRKVEGLICRRGEHASGVILYNEDPWNTGAIMRSPNGDLTTQFSLHHAEYLGDTKFDFLLTEACSKLANTLILLHNNGYFVECSTYREIYEKYLHPDAMDWNDTKLWDTLCAGKVIDLFQFDSAVGGQAIKSIQPRSPLQLMMANALTRLTGERGMERPIDRYVRLKNDMKQWYAECSEWGLTSEEVKYLEPYYLPVFGCPTTQEKLMLLCMDEHIGHFTLKEANSARKIVAKKKIKEIPVLKEKFLSQCPRRELGEYVWQTAILPQASYSFAEPCNGVNTLNH